MKAQHKALILIIIGYIYLSLLLIIGLAVTIASLAGIVIGQQLLLIKILLIAGTFTYLLSRSLFIHNPEPTGFELNDKLTPDLFQKINELTNKTRSKPIHKILLTLDFNAAVIQYKPRLLLGRYKNYLLLGFPLLLSLDIEELNAVLAHEMGHISRKHGILGNHIYRARYTWLRFFSLLSKHNHNFLGNLLVLNFLKKYVPLLDKLAFSISRKNEYEADKIAVELSGKQVFSRALSNVELRTYLFDNLFWESLTVNNKSTQHIEDIKPYTLLKDYFKKEIRNEYTDAYQNIIKKQKAKENDTHPAIQERLLAREVDFLFTYKIDSSAAEILLNDKLNILLEMCDKDWQRKNKDKWFNLYKELKIQEDFIQKNEGKFDELTLDDKVKYAFAMEMLNGKSSAISWFEKIISIDPANADANYSIGMDYYLKNDKKCLDYFEKLNNNRVKNIDLTLKAMYAAMGFCRRDDLTERFNKFQSVYDENLPLYEEIVFDRNNISLSTQVEKHDLQPQVVKEIEAARAFYPEITGCLIAKKQLNHEEFGSVYIMLIEINEKNKKKKQQIFEDFLHISKISSSFIPVMYNPDLVWLDKKMKDALH